MAMARPGGIHGVMEVKKEDHWAGEDSLNHSAGRCFLPFNAFAFLLLIDPMVRTRTRKPRREIDPT